jgi:hypothetical protein
VRLRGCFVSVVAVFFSAIVAPSAPRRRDYPERIALSAVAV